MKRWAWLIPAVLAVAAYLPSLDAGLVWDDDIVLKTQITYFRTPRDAFFPPDGIPEFGIAYYRPLVSLTYLFDFGIFGRDATTGPHATNILLHALTTLFVFVLVRRMLRGRAGETWAAALAASIFAVHPIHVESVSWISGRSDPLAAALVLPSILLALRYRRTGSIAALMGAPMLYLMALLSKEVAASALVLVPVLMVLQPNPREDSAAPAPGAPAIWQLWLRLGGGFLVATIVYVILRQMNGIGSGATMLLPLSEWPDRLLRSSAYYLLKVMVPPPQCHVVFASLMPGTVASALLALLGAGAVIGGVVRWRSRGRPDLLIACAWFALTLAPSLVVTLGRISETPLAERYLYLPSVALSLVVGAILCSAVGSPRLRAATFAVGIGLTLAFAAGTLHRGRVWVDDLRLWTDAGEKVPGEGLIWLNLGQAHFEMGDHDQAFECYTRAIEERYDTEGRAKAHNNRGMILRERGRLDDADVEFRAAIAEDPGYATPHYGLGMNLMARVDEAVRRQDFVGATSLEALAIDAFGEALRRNPRYARAMWGLAWARIFAASTHALAGRPAEAAAQYQAASEQLDGLERIEPGFSIGGLSFGQAREMIRRGLQGLPR